MDTNSTIGVKFIDGESDVFESGSFILGDAQTLIDDMVAVGLSDNPHILGGFKDLEIQEDWVREQDQNNSLVKFIIDNDISWDFHYDDFKKWLEGSKKSNYKFGADDWIYVAKIVD